MTPAAHHLLRALYLHALAPSTANQDAVRAAGAALDTETGRKLNAPRVQRSSGNVFRDLGRPDADAKFEAAKEAAKGLPCHADALPIAEAVSRKILDRAAFGLRKYGVSLDDAGLDPAAWLLHLQEELLDAANYVESFRRAVANRPAWSARDTAAFLLLQAERDQLQAKVDAMAAPATLRRPGRDDEADAIDAGIEAAEAATPDLLWGKSELLIAKVAATAAVQGLWERMTDAPCDNPTTAPVEPPHASAPFLATLTPEPAEAVLGRAGEALAETRSDLASRAWQGALGKLVRETPSGEALAGSLPVYVLAGTGRHPYGDDAWHMETDGVARLFPSKDAAQRWLAAMGKAPV